MTTIVRPAADANAVRRAAPQLFSFPEGQLLPVRMPSAPGELISLDAYKRAQAEARAQAAERRAWADHCAAQAARRRSWKRLEALVWLVNLTLFAVVALKFLAA